MFAFAKTVFETSGGAFPAIFDTVPCQEYRSRGKAIANCE